MSGEQWDELVTMAKQAKTVAGPWERFEGSSSRMLASGDIAVRVEADGGPGRPGWLMSIPPLTQRVHGLKSREEAEQVADLLLAQGGITLR